MYRFIYTFLGLVFTSTFLSAQSDYTGLWQGTLNETLILNIEILAVDSVTLESLISVQVQGIEDVRASRTEVVHDTLIIYFSQYNARYQGVLRSESHIEGKWIQNGEAALALAKVDAKHTWNRPQTPHPPFPYDIEEFSWRNSNANITLSGTLTLPKGKGPFPTVVLISGSGATQRDAEILGHKIFLVLADALTRADIAVLRYDDRGVGLSEGSHHLATSLDLASDAASAVLALYGHSRVDTNRLGLIGHSEGGMIAPIVASEHPEVDYIICLAGPSVAVDTLMVEQNALVFESMGMPDSLVQNNRAYNHKLYSILNKGNEIQELYDTLIPHIHGYYENLPPKYQSWFGPSKELYYLNLMTQLSSPWMRYFLAHDPAPYIQKVNCPIMAVNGSLDIQVPSNLNLYSFKILTGDHDDRTIIKEYEGLNHLFQHAETGNISEYGQIEESFSEEVIQDIITWIINL